MSFVDVVHCSGTFIVPLSVLGKKRLANKGVESVTIVLHLRSLQGSSYAFGKEGTQKEWLRKGGTEESLSNEILCTLVINSMVTSISHSLLTNRVFGQMLLWQALLTLTCSNCVCFMTEVQPRGMLIGNLYFIRNRQELRQL